MDSNALIHRYFLGDLTEAETHELDGLLANDTGLRREFAIAAAMDTGLREVAFERAVEPQSVLPPTKDRTAFRFFSTALLAGLVVAAAVVFVVMPRVFEASPVATLASSENAAWESSLPTTPGSELSPGLMKLVSGIATIRFRSGAEVMMEAPANLVLISPMRSRLLDGAAVISVPEPAIGFVLETPNGYVVDHGTQFAVSVGEQSDFEVIDGEISVHLSSTGEEVRLTDQQSASISKQQLTSFDGQIPEPEPEQTARVLRIGTDGRATSLIRNNKRKKRYRPDLLMVKRGHSEGWDRRSVFSFDTTAVDFDDVASVCVRLNLVPSGIGFATRLPRINQFAIYGLTNDARRDWQIESRWEDAPNVEDGELLGTFEIPRSVQRGSFGIDNERLLEFLKVQDARVVTFILVRETGQIEGEGPGLVHAFAADSHAEAAGPVLEFSFAEHQ